MDVTSSTIRKRRHSIDLDLVTALRAQKFGLTEITEHPEVAVSRWTLLRWRRDVNFVDPRVNISDESLNDIVANHIDDQIGAHISNLGLNVPRSQLRESMRTVDPEGVASRSKKPIRPSLLCSWTSFIISGIKMATISLLTGGLLFMDA